MKCLLEAVTNMKAVKYADLKISVDGGEDSSEDFVEIKK